ncbi:hypothetical protein METH_10010 [Leisingera methylohalidivorans DSM 14336]|uniref:Uncharacterized protein n=1 Tax=Leisingera methylohalidivorans DSM 14336 TaxID=999552 RepID=V9W088_9RHOB|nr:hypothetical protein METH_10010 [Leisingera methylohalidivorans DSM 14336]
MTPASSQKLNRAFPKDVPPTFLVLMKISINGWQMIIGFSKPAVFGEISQNT